MFNKIQFAISKSMTENVIKDLNEKHKIEIERLNSKHENEKKNIEKLHEHQIAHLNRERKEALERLSNENKSEIAKLSDKVRALNAQVNNEKDHTKKERELFYKLEKAYKKKMSEFEFLTNNLKRWIKTEYGELIRLSVENEDILEKAEKETSNLSKELREIIEESEAPNKEKK